MNAQNLSGTQFRQDTLWGESGAWLAADRQVRENMARRLTETKGAPQFVRHMGESNATRADMLTLEHVNPRVEMGWRAGGSYDALSNIVEYGRSSEGSETRHSLYHELGHALHIGGQRFGGSKMSAAHNPDPVQEGVADGVADRMSHGGPGGAWTYRDSDQYNDADGGSYPEDTILEGGPNWGHEGRTAYEASRSLAASGQMPTAPHWSYRSGTVSQLTETPGYAATVKPEHQQGLQAAVARDSEARHGQITQQKLF
jgi:hypothetical protein